MESKSLAIGIWKVVFVFTRGGINSMVGSKQEKLGQDPFMLACHAHTAQHGFLDS